MRIHAIQTGTVAIKTRQVEGVGHGSRRQLNMFLDREWTEPLPIYAFAIEHPEGVIVVDTGESARTADSDYFPSWHPFYRYGLREWVAPEDEIGPQLRELGILGRRRSLGRADASAHRPCPWPAPLPAHRDPRFPR